jgi:2-polyprenyl-6-methoxyphenol hydroxylase-like FAD-dependent oxidoreductase
MSSEDLPVAIIGAGMAGPVLALLLHQHSIPCILYDVRSSETQQGGNIALAPNALRVLHHVGVYDRLRLQGYNYEEIAFMNGSGLVLGRLLNGSQKVYNFPALRIHRSVVKEELIRECEKKGIEIQWGRKCTGIEEETERGVVVNFADGKKVKARFVVGADGIHSHVRSWIASGKTPQYSGLMGIMGTVMANDLKSLEDGHNLDLPCMIFGGKGSFAIMPSSFDGKEVGFFATIEEHDRTREEWEALGENTTRLRDMLGERFLPDENGFPPLVKELVNKTPNETLTRWPCVLVN